MLSVEAVEEGAAAFAVGTVERGDEHLDGTAHLAAERGGDFLLVLQAAAVEGVEGLFGRAVEEGAGGEEVAEGAQCETLVKPQLGVEIGEAGGLAGFGVDQREALAVGDQAERDVRGVQQLRHARGAGRVPGGGGRAPIGLLCRRKQAHQQARLAVFDQGQVGAQGLVVLCDEKGEVLWNGVVFDQQIGRPFEQGQKDGAQPLALGGADGVRRQRAGGPPLGVDFAEFARLIGCVLDEALREDLAEDRQADKRARDFDELQQFGVLGGGGHQASPSGTRKVTATGNRRGCGSA